MKNTTLISECCGVTYEVEEGRCRECYEDCVGTEWCMECEESFEICKCTK